MSNLLQSGMAWLGGRMKEFTTQPVLYTRLDGGGTLSLQATVSPAQRLLDSGQVVTLSHEEQDFTITAADLVIGGEPFQPARGDVIRASIGGVEDDYTITLNGNNEAWDWTDSSHTRMRVQTKK